MGPALYYSILIAARKPGSKVILCTDGLANKGNGALDSNDDQSAYYNELATFATNKGYVKNSNYFLSSEFLSSNFSAL